ncbi:uncharacterized protein LOC136034829 isoform X2 [Artemia franciscana]|uniref:uncharacterized protein LOC136034829 isoform X2 n=1 Tax=Artemia franciscana TaxID=6661 RepID=UPI0032DAC7B3
MVVGGGVAGGHDINNIMGGLESTGGVMLHNHKRKLRQRFDLIKKLGQGTYGKVQLGVNKETGQQVAIKTIKKAKIETDADLIRIKREIQIMSSVQHPYIIHIYEVFENREKIVLVMEYAAGGELYDYLSESKVLSEEEARRIFRQVASAVYYCHKHKICHRDLKLENILLDTEGNAKIADFGLSNVFDGKRMLTTFCGSPLYASPEIVRGIPYQGPEVDCWSLGVLLYTLVYGAMPFDGSNFKRLVKQICQGEYYEPKKPTPSSPLIRLMLAVDAQKRANVEDICSHWWVNQGYPGSCLEAAEELSNKTPVRLDLLLLLADPPQSSSCVDVDDETRPQTSENNVETEPTKPSRKISHSNSASNFTSKPVDDPMEGPSERKPKKRTKSEKRKRETHVEESAEKSATEQSPKRPAPDEIDTSIPLNKSSPVIDQIVPDEFTNKDELKLKGGFQTVEDKIISEIVRQCDTISEKSEASTTQLLELPKVDIDNDSVPKSLTFVKPQELDSPNQDSGFQSIEPIQQEPPMPKSATFTVKKDDVADIPKEDEIPKVNDTKNINFDNNRLSIGSAISEALSDTSRSEIMSGTTSPGTLSPTRNTEKRQSRILKQAELFNRLSESQGDIKTMTLERPKKVTSFGFRVGDMKSKFEAKVNEPKKISVASAFKVSDAKKAFEIVAAVSSSQSTLPKVSAFPKRTIIQAPDATPLTLQKFPLKSQTHAVANKPTMVQKTAADTSKSSVDIRTKIVQPDSESSQKSEIIKTESNVLTKEEKDRDNSKETGSENIVVKQDVKMGAKDQSRDRKVETTVSNNSTAYKKTQGVEKPDEKNKADAVPVFLAKKFVSKETTPASEEEESSVVVGGLGISIGRVTDANKVGIKTEEQSIKIVRPKEKDDSLRPLDLKQQLNNTVVESKEPGFVPAITPKALSVKEEAKVKKVKPPPLDIKAAQQVETKVLIDSGEKELKEGIVLLSGSPAFVNQKGKGSVQSPEKGKTTEIKVQIASPISTATSKSVAPKTIGRIECPTRASSERIASPPRASSIPVKREHIIPIMVEGRDLSYLREASVASEGLSPISEVDQRNEKRDAFSDASISSPLSERELSVPRGDPIRKSPREFIIPISVEGGGMVTPKPEEHAHPTGTFGRRKNRQSSQTGDGSRDSPFNTLKRLSSFGKGYFDEKEDEFLSFANRMASRRLGRHLDHSDSSGEESDDDTFQILTAESLFSNLLSRVRNISRRTHRDDPFASFRQSSRIESNRGHDSGSQRVSSETPSRVSQRPSSVIDNVIRRSTDSDTSMLGRSSVHEDDMPWRRRQSSREPSVSSVPLENRGTESQLGRSTFQPVLRRSVTTNQEDGEPSPNWTVLRLNSSSRDSRKEYNRTKSSKELGEDSLTKRSIHRYGRAITLDSIEVEDNDLKRLGSPLAEDTQSRGETPISYRTYTRTCSREYLSPENDKVNWNYNTLPNLRKSRFILEEETKETAVNNITAALCKPMQRVKSPPPTDEKVLESALSPVRVISYQTNTTSPIPVENVLRATPRPAENVQADINKVKNNLDVSKCEDQKDKQDLLVSPIFVPPKTSSVATTKAVDEAAKLFAKAEAEIAERFYSPTRDVSNHICEPKVSASEAVAKRVSRFLRPDFYETPKDQSDFAKEKEIAAKSKSRFLKNFQKNSENNNETSEPAKTVGADLRKENISQDVSVVKSEIANSDAVNFNVVSNTTLRPLLKSFPDKATSPSIILEPKAVCTMKKETTELEVALAPLKVVTQPIKTAQNGKTQIKSEQKRPSPPSALPKAKTPPRPLSHLVNPPVAPPKRLTTPMMAATPLRGITPPKARGITPPKVSLKKVEGVPKSTSPPKNSKSTPKETSKQSSDIGATKSSPKIKVKKHWENLMNLATSSFQKNSSPAKTDKADQVTEIQPPRECSKPRQVPSACSTQPTNETLVHSKFNGNLEYTNQGNSSKSAITNQSSTAQVNPPINQDNQDGSEDYNGTETPTSYDSRSVCSDLQSEKNLDDEESVSDRIHRKSFYTRFNDRRKSRRSSTKEIIDLQQQLTEIACRNQSVGRDESPAEASDSRKSSGSRRSVSNFDSIQENDISLSFRERDRGSTLSPSRTESVRIPRTWRVSQDTVTKSVASVESHPSEYKQYSRTPSRFIDKTNVSVPTRRFTAEVEANATIPRRSNRYSVFEPTTSTPIGSYTSRIGLPEPRLQSNRYSTLLEDRGRMSSVTRSSIGQSSLGRRDPPVTGDITSRDSSIPRRDYGFLRSTSTGYDGGYRRDSSLSSRLKRY